VIDAFDSQSFHAGSNANAPSAITAFLYLCRHKMKSTFTKQNYWLLIAGIILIGLGYLLMTGGGSEDPAVFNPAIFGFRRITLAPIICVIGFVLIIFAIMWRPTGEPTLSDKKRTNLPVK
jgi:uncharacterized membrane protein